ncbi:hypothetical protein [Chitinophaga nivalis]|uniref:Uncharacterized protein n=1 Tax=Chitinophaga nivalis TaxID=2991709 RepID=A0ABT3IMP3_9BACT|nr:hypothetical protein [Chitinophaga nivalis]MCW3465066.1 hypothetical protein [Chitinophaga nivalis]MCW3485242.1 hypothetical protein [Chitinophaga nivalis]
MTRKIGAFPREVIRESGKFFIPPANRAFVIGYPRPLQGRTGFSPTPDRWVSYGQVYPLRRKSDRPERRWYPGPLNPIA